MNSMYFLQGAVIAFLLAIPIGPIGILCIRRTLEHGARYGLEIGVSAAFCDMMSSIVAAFGVTLVSDFITLERHWIRLVGGIILLVIGYGAFRLHPLAEKGRKRRCGHAWAFISTALLAFTNPLALFAFAAAFAAVGVDKSVGHPVSGVMLVAGVFFGSLTWFVLLAWLVHCFKEKVMRAELTLINRAAGVLLMLCGFYAVGSGIRGL